MKIKKEILEKRWVQIALGLSAALLFYLCISHIHLLFVGLGKLFKFLSPVLIGLVIAYLIDPLVQVFEEKVYKNLNIKHKHVLAVVTAIVIVIIAFIILLVALVPPIIESIINLVNNFSNYSYTLQHSLKELTQFAKQNNIDISGLTHASGNILQSISSLLPENFNGIGDIVKNAINLGIGFINFIISFIIAIYFLVDAKHLQYGLGRLLRAILGKQRYQTGHAFWVRCNRILIKFVITDLLDGLLIGVVNFIFMSIMRMPFVALVSVVVGVTNLAPTFGPFVGGFIGAFLLILINPLDALWFIIFTIFLQLCDGYVIKPKLFGGAFDVPSVWILVFIVVGGRMFGVIGILLAIPVAAIVTFVYRESFLPYLERRQLKKESMDV